MENLANTRGKRVIGIWNWKYRAWCTKCMLRCLFSQIRHYLIRFLRPLFYISISHVSLLLSVIVAKLFSKKMNIVSVWRFFRPFIHVKVNFHKRASFRRKKYSCLVFFFHVFVLFNKIKSSICDDSPRSEVL